MGIKGEYSSGCIVCVLFIGKTDLPMLMCNQSVIADGNPMGVVPKVFDQTIGRGKGFLAVHDPWLCVTLGLDAPKRYATIGQDQPTCRQGFIQ
jgi:hypothetical protein